jgi:hypothetical protein
MTVQRRALDPATNLRNQSYESAARGTKIYALQPRATRELLRLDGSVDSHVIVRDVISPQLDLRIGTGSPNRPDPSRALIGGACRSWQ